MQASVFRLVDNPHTATTELFHNAVARNGLTDHFEARNLTSVKQSKSMKTEASRVKIPGDAMRSDQCVTVSPSSAYDEQVDEEKK